MKESTITSEMLKALKKTLSVPFKELKISPDLSFIIFELGAEPYYIKVVS